MDHGNLLLQAAVFLAAAAIAAPLARYLKIGSVLGYLIAGLAIGPFGFGIVHGDKDVEEILHIAEFGVVILLFVIGLELRPQRLLSMRTAVFGAGAMQVGISSVLLIASGLVLGLTTPQAIIVGLALALSSTAFVLQMLDEKGERDQPHGRLSFSVLLFQDLAAIPIIAIIPAFALQDTAVGLDWSTLFNALKALAIVGLVIVIGRFALGPMFRLVALSRVREAMTASALLTVVGVALLMQVAGLSAALGAFLVGALLAESEYRHQIEADIAPFEGLLLGLFFTAIGMSLNIEIVSYDPLTIGLLVVGLLAVKAVVLFGVARWWGLDFPDSRRTAFAMSQAGEFAFVIISIALAERILWPAMAGLITVVVTLSMVATPLLLVIDDLLRQRRKQHAEQTGFDEMPEHDGHVVIAGFGRFAQIIARVLAAKGIAFTALDSNPDQVRLVRRFGNKAYFGDAGRLDILQAAQVDKARAFILTVANPEQSVRTARLVRENFPHVKIYARALDRRHVYDLMDLDVTLIHRDTFYSALAVTSDLLKGLGYSDAQAQRAVDVFEDYDQRRLIEDYPHHHDFDRIADSAKRQAAELEAILKEDAEVLVADEVAQALDSGEIELFPEDGENRPRTTAEK